MLFVDSRSAWQSRRLLRRGNSAERGVRFDASLAVSLSGRKVAARCTHRIPAGRARAAPSHGKSAERPTERVQNPTCSPSPAQLRAGYALEFRPCQTCCDGCRACLCLRCGRGRSLWLHTLWIQRRCPSSKQRLRGPFRRRRALVLCDRRHQLLLRSCLRRLPSGSMEILRLV